LEFPTISHQRGDATLDRDLAKKKLKNETLKAEIGLLLRFTPPATIGRARWSRPDTNC
jgi:hypothetical protein